MRLESKTRIESEYKDHEDRWELSKQRLGLSRQWENQQGRDHHGTLKKSRFEDQAVSPAGCLEKKSPRHLTMLIYQ